MDMVVDVYGYFLSLDLATIMAKEAMVICHTQAWYHNTYIIGIKGIKYLAS